MEFADGGNQDDNRIRQTSGFRLGISISGKNIVFKHIRQSCESIRMEIEWIVNTLNKMLNNILLLSRAKKSHPVSYSQALYFKIS